MMTKEQVSERIEKKNKDIEKINRRIIKWSTSLTEQDIAMAKEYGMMDYENPLKKEARQRLNNYILVHSQSRYFSPIDELANAYNDLREANKTLEKYNVQMNEIINFEKEDKIEVLVEFLNAWREQAYEWYVRNAEQYKQLKAKEDEEFKKYLEELEQRYGKSTQSRDSYYFKQQFREEYYRGITSLTKEITGYSHTDTDKLNKILDDEVVAKYKDLVFRITKEVGEILDVLGLSIGEQSGEINGIVKGKLGTAKVETISAGGYNQNQIVNVKHGQIFHYRVLVHKFKE